MTQLNRHASHLAREMARAHRRHGTASGHGYGTAAAGRRLSLRRSTCLCCQAHSSAAKRGIVTGGAALTGNLTARSESRMGSHAMGHVLFDRRPQAD
jgi:hypothetical protein